MENRPLHTVLGSTGVIGTETAMALAAFPVRIRLVSRNPRKVNEDNEVLTADLTDLAQTLKAVEGSEVVYLTVGFPYDADLWAKTWPGVMQNVITACEQYKAKLVFFDNNYVYARETIPNQTETSRIAPSSKKGAVRAEIVRTLEAAIKAGRITALIARSPDIYGPRIVERSALMEFVYTNLIKDKAATWLLNADKAHTFGYTPDLGRSMAELGNAPDAFGQVWHLPTTHEGLTGRQWTTLFAEAMGKPDKISVMPRWLYTIIGLFVPYLKEAKEMDYMWGTDYRSHSDKFEKRFGWGATLPKEAVAETVAQNKAN